MKKIIRGIARLGDFEVVGEFVDCVLYEESVELTLKDACITHGTPFADTVKEITVQTVMANIMITTVWIEEEEGGEDDNE